MGRWRIVEHGWGLDSPLQGLEIRRLSAAGDALVIAYGRDDRGRERVWGSARLDRMALVATSARWVKAEWASGPTAVQIQLRPERGGRLVVLIRQRDRNRPAGGGERVRQVVLEREPAETAPSPGGPATSLSRFEVEGPPGARAEPAGIFLVGRDGAGLRAVSLPDGYSRAAHPAWSTDGRWVAFTAFDPTGRDPLIRIVSADGGRTTAVASGIAPTWSRDGSRLAYVASGRPEFATDWNAPGRNDERIEAIRLTGPGAGEVEVLARGLWPRWSPTDDRLAFSMRREVNWDIHVRSADGLNLIRLTDDPALDTRPIWAVDGRALMFLSDRGNRWDLFRVAADGRGEATRLTDQRRREDGADLSPDGESVAFTDGAGGPDSRILLLDLASGLVRPLLDPPDGDRDPAWSPDGRSVAFASRRAGPSATSAGPRRE